MGPDVDFRYRYQCNESSHANKFIASLSVVQNISKPHRTNRTEHAQRGQVSDPYLAVKLQIDTLNDW